MSICAVVAQILGETHPGDVIATGTLGCRLVAKDGNVYALSCNHVYALENQGIVDSTPASQPSPLDVSCAVISDNDIGKLKAFVKIDFSGGSNTADCAIVGTTTNMVGNATPGNRVEGERRRSL
jgi:hypothetical protein